MIIFKNMMSFTLDSFFKQFCKIFQDSAMQQKTINQLNSLQQDNHTFNKFIIKFDCLFLKTENHTWDNKIKKRYLKSILIYSLKNHMMKIKEKKTYKNYCQQLKIITNQINKLKRIALQSELYQNFSTHRHSNNNELIMN